MNTPTATEPQKVRKGSGAPRGQHSQLKHYSAKERQRQGLELRKAGATYQQIADQLGYKHASSASKAVKKALDSLVTESADDLRVIEVARLNHMMLAIWDRIQGGDLKAIDRGLRIQQRMSELMGLDAPSKSETVNVQTHVVTIEGDKDAYIRALQEARGELPVGVIEGEVVEE